MLEPRHTQASIATLLPSPATPQRLRPMLLCQPTTQNIQNTCLIVAYNGVLSVSGSW